MPTSMPSLVMVVEVARLVAAAEARRRRYRLRLACSSFRGTTGLIAVSNAAEHRHHVLVDEQERRRWPSSHKRCQHQDQDQDQ